MSESGGPKKSFTIGADKPLTDPSDDRLGYGLFAKMLATSVLDGCPAAGLVVAIYGPWGLGKTTLLNFIAREVENDANGYEAIVVRFNPWWFSGREDLTRRFFEEFERAVFAKKAKKKELVNVLKRYTDSIGSTLTAIADKFEPRASFIGKMISAVARPPVPPNIVELKAELDSALAAEATRILVLIDDIDRLPPDDMLEVFRLVKAVGDLPNVIYVLAFDREASTRVLAEQFGEFGTRYLEKIVQVEFDLPVPTRDAITGLFSSRFDKLIADTPPDLVDDQRLAKLYLAGISPLLRTPRDVSRLLNALSVTLPRVVRDVNPIDFLGMEGLRVFSPRAYALIREQSSHFVGIDAMAAMGSDRDVRSREESFHERWLSTLGTERGFVEVLVSLLFPGIPLVGRSPAKIDQAIARKQRRVCTEENFDLYFRYQLSTDRLTRDAFAEIVNSADEKAMRARLERLRADGTRPGIQFRTFLEDVRDELLGGGKIPRPQILVSAICAVGDEVAGQQARDMLVVGDDLMLAFVVEALLRELPGSSRLQIVKNALESAGIVTTVRVGTTIGSQYGRYGEDQATPEPDRALQSVAEVEELERYVVSRIKKSAASGELWNSLRLVLILDAWRLLGDEESMKIWIAERTSSDAELVRFLRRGAAIDPRSRRYPIERVAELFDLDALTPRISSIVEASSAEPSDMLLLRGLVADLRKRSPDSTEQKPPE